MAQAKYRWNQHTTPNPICSSSSSMTQHSVDTETCGQPPFSVLIRLRKTRNSSAQCLSVSPTDSHDARSSLGQICNFYSHIRMYFLLPVAVSPASRICRRESIPSAASVVVRVAVMSPPCGSASPWDGSAYCHILRLDYLSKRCLHALFLINWFANNFDSSLLKSLSVEDFWVSLAFNIVIDVLAYLRMIWRIWELGLDADCGEADRNYPVLNV